MRRMAIRAGATVPVLAVALALAACGSGSTSGRDATVSAAGRGGAGSTSGSGGSGGAQGNGSGSETGAGHGDPRESSCQAQVGDFVHSLATLRRRLVAGLTYQQYVSEMRAIRTTYEAVPVSKLDVTCLSAVGGPSESSFNTYLDAGNDWGECVGTPGCEAATVEPVLQRKWRLASGALSEAEHALAGQIRTGS